MIVALAGATFLGAEVWAEGAFGRGAVRRRPSPARDNLALKRVAIAADAERVNGRVDLRALRHADYAPVPGRRASAPYAVGKRLFDIVTATLLLLFFGPLLLITMIAVKLETRGPALFRQARVGLDGREFQMLKIRSMRDDAERAGVRWASSDDPRVTRIGRIIRRLRIDEIPQALNVLQGDMSFVGPRPERPEFVKILEREIPNYHLRHLVKPGITGWAQVK